MSFYRQIINLLQCNSNVFLYQFKQFFIYLTQSNVLNMLTRSKVKLQQSVRHVHHDLPYFNQQQQKIIANMYKPLKNINHSKVSNHYNETQQNYRTEYFQHNHTTHTTKNGNFSRNEILKELRQEYQILKNLPIDDNVNINIKKYEFQDASRLSQSSSVSSSIHSKKSSKVKGSQKQFGSPKLGSKELEAMHLEKKQLEIVIGNSMRKIEELLNNQILLKKTIHELKNQIQGKGGVHQQNEKNIKTMQKTIDELQEELNKSEYQNDKTVQKIKELNEKIRYLQGELGSKERQIKQGFDQQRRLHELIRIEKDKFLNLEIQSKTYKMQFELLEKQKNNEINRLIRQFQSKQGGNEKQMAYIIKKLEEDIKQKDKKYHDLLLQKQQIKRDKERQIDAVIQKSQRNYLQELMYKSREMNDYNSKALTDSMNLIIVKMAELQKKNDATLKRQIQALKKKTDDNKRNTSEADLLARITELQRMIEREVSQKNRLAEDIKTMKQHKYELEDKNKALDKKLRQLEQRQHQLREQIQQLEHIKLSFDSTSNEYKKLQEEIASYTQRIKLQEIEIERLRGYSNTFSLSFKDKQKKYEDEIRVLRRQVDEARFETEKTLRQAEFNINMLKAEHDVQLKRQSEEINSLSLKIREMEISLTGAQTESINLKQTIQSLRLKSEEDITNQQRFYSEKISIIENRHAQQIKAFNDKFMAVTTTNEKLMTQLSTFSRMQTQMVQLRRGLKQARAMNSSINHLWDIKEVEYGNINDALNSLKMA